MSIDRLMNKEAVLHIYNGVLVSHRKECIQVSSNEVDKSTDFPVAQTVKNLPAMQETRVRSLGWEVLLEKRMAIHSSILAWRIPWTEKSGGLQSMGWQRVRHD